MLLHPLILFIVYVPFSKALPQYPYRGVLSIATEQGFFLHDYKNWWVVVDYSNQPQYAHYDVQAVHLDGVITLRF